MARAKKTYNRGRAWLAGILVTVAVILLPSAVVTNWATVQVSNTQQFVKTLAPLASNPEVQDLIVNEATKAIDNAVDIQSTTQTLVTGLGDALNLPPAAASALGLVADPIANGVKGLIHDLVQKAVESKAFQEAWTQTLTLTQEQVTALLAGDEKSVLKLANDGTITMPLGPVIDGIKKALVDQGVGFASLIPTVDKDITIATIPELGMVRVIYQVGVGVGTWLPWIVLAMILVGVIAANRRMRAVFGASIAVFVVSVVMLIAFNFGSNVLSFTLPADYASVSTIIYAAIIGYVQEVLGALIALSVITGITGWLFYAKGAAPIRAWSGAQLDALRGGLSKIGMTMGAAGQQLYKVRVAVRTIIIAVGGLIVAFNTPITVPLVIWTTVVVLIVLFVYELLLRSPQAAVAAKVAAAAPTATAQVVKQAAKRAAKPAAKSAAKPAAKPAAKKAPSRKPAAKTAAKPAAKKATGATTAKKSGTGAKKK